MLGLLTDAHQNEAVGDVTVVFAYPGLGIGTTHPELAGCTSQMLQLSTAGLRLTTLGIRVAGLSTEPAERHAHLGWLAPRVLRAGADEAATLPHTDTPTGRYLERFTMVIGGRHDGLMVTDIDDSAAHTIAVIELLECARAEDWVAAAGLSAAPGPLGAAGNDSELGRRA